MKLKIVVVIILSLFLFGCSRSVDNELLLVSQKKSNLSYQQIIELSHKYCDKAEETMLIDKAMYNYHKSEICLLQAIILQNEEILRKLDKK